MADSKASSTRPRPASASSPDRTARRLERQVGKPRASAPSSDAPVIDEIDAVAVGGDGQPGESVRVNIVGPTVSQPAAARQPLVSLLGRVKCEPFVPPDSRPTCLFRAL